MSGYGERLQRLGAATDELVHAIGQCSPQRRSRLVLDLRALFDEEAPDGEQAAPEAALVAALARLVAVVEMNEEDMERQKRARDV